jgi:RHS repeat-associated protein
LVLRDRDSNGDGTLDERLWVVQDANYNVTALFDNSGNVVERYIYDPFGQVTILDANWNVLTASAFGWAHLHQGGRFDATSGLYHFRYRDYSSTLGRWTSLDPLSYAAGDVNLYRPLGNDPLNSLDPSGLDDDIPLPDAVAVPVPNPRLPVLFPPPPIPSWFDRLSDEVQMIGTFVVNSPGEAAWEYYTGLAYGAYGVFVEPVVNTGKVIVDVGGFMLIDGYEPLNPHIQGMLNGERTWYGGTVSLVVDGLGVIPLARGGQQVIRLGGSAWGGTNALTVLRPNAVEQLIPLSNNSSRLSSILRDPKSVADFTLAEQLELQLKHRSLISRLEQGDVPMPLGAMAIRHPVTGVIMTSPTQLMGELTVATGREVALIRIGNQRFLRLGNSDGVAVIDADRVIAHTHPSGVLKFSIGRDSDVAVFNNPSLKLSKQKSSVLVAPDGTAVRLPIPRQR